MDKIRSIFLLVTAILVLMLMLIGFPALAEETKAEQRTHREGQVPVNHKGTGQACMLTLRALRTFIVINSYE